jgi:hypothetical protein
MEHGGLAGPEQRARAVALGIPVTIQQPLPHDTAEARREHAPDAARPPFGRRRELSDRP